MAAVLGGVAMKEWLMAVYDAGMRWRYRCRKQQQMSWRAASRYPFPEREQLEQYAQAFYALAALFQKLPCQREHLGDAEVEQLLLQMQEAACTGCAGKERCWNTEYYENWGVLSHLLQELEQYGEITEDGMEAWNQICVEPELAANAMTQAYARQRSLLFWNNRLMEQRTAVGEEIYQTAELWRNLAEAMEGNPQKEERLYGKLRGELRYLGIELGSLRISRQKEGRTELFLVLRARKKLPVSAKTVAEVVSNHFSEKMRPAWNCAAVPGEQFETFHFVPETRYQMLCGISRITKDGELVSGDNYAFLQKDTGKIVMSLADGMGSGVGACRESEKVIELLEQFLLAGFPQETAVRMINSCMLLQSREQMFSTMDLCMVDLYTAGCDLIKLGAAATFVQSSGEIEVIQSSAAPAGILQQTDYESLHRQLKAGDMVVMMTDGVLDALPEENREETMMELIRKSASVNAREHARKLMERVYLMQKLQARDDMTILIGKIWEK